MEVSGKKDFKSETKKSHESPNGVLCQPCLADGENLYADGFCQQCQEHLCRTCVKYHRKATPSKHHVILDKNIMPKNVVPQTIKNICTEHCEKHRQEVIKFFCNDHMTSGCGACMINEHKLCQVDFIPDVADDFVNGVEYKKVLSKLEELRNTVETVKSDLQQSKQKTANAYTSAIEDIRRFRKEIEGYLFNMEKRIIAECDQLKLENEAVVKNIEDGLKSFKNELDGMYNRLNSQSKEAGDIFVLAKKTTTRLRELQEELERETRLQAVKSFEFERNKGLEDTIALANQLGKLTVVNIAECHSPGSTEVVDFVPVLASEINVKLPDDKMTPYISSMISISQDVLLCVDRNNNSVKVVDMERGVICSEMYLESGPWDITQVTGDIVAVTVPDNKEICILQLKEKELSGRRKMKVFSDCRGIACANNNLIVSYENSIMQILNLYGQVLQTFNVGDTNSWPGCVDIGIHQDCVFVSDFRRHCVFKLALDGKLLGKYEDTKLQSPRTLTVCKDGSVLVCSSNGHSVHLISSECNKIRILLDEDVARNAQSVCYSETTASLYLYRYRNDEYKTIQVYRNA